MAKYTFEISRLRPSGFARNDIPATKTAKNVDEGGKIPGSATKTAKNVDEGGKIPGFGHKNGQKRGRRMVVGIWLRHKLSCGLDGIGETVGPIIADIEFDRDSVLEAAWAYFY